MNPVFWFLLATMLLVSWLAISFIFIPVGILLARGLKRLLNIINYEEKEEKEKSEE